MRGKGFGESQQPVIPTSEKLARAMAEAGCSSEMIQKARDNYYDDYKSAIATPQTQLVRDLTQAGQNALARRAMNDEFAGTQAEGNAWWLKEGQFLLPHGPDLI